MWFKIVLLVLIFLIFTAIDDVSDSIERLNKILIEFKNMESEDKQ